MSSESINEGMTPNQQMGELKRRFGIEDHHVRKGGFGQWFVYIKREAIIARLDEVFPMSWNDTIVSTSRYDKTVTAIVAITINNVTREYNGSAEDKPIKDKATKEIIGWQSENTEKSAVTDAFKRAASQWGIGLYLQHVTENKAGNEQQAIEQFKGWYNKQFGFKTEVNPTPRTPAPQPEQNGSSYDQGSSLHMKIRDVFPDYHPVTTLKAMGMDSLDDFANLSQAAARIKDHCYSSLAPVKVKWQRYVITKTTKGKIAKCLEFCNDPDPKLQHGIVGCYGRSTRVKNMLDGISINLYKELNLMTYDRFKTQEKPMETTWLEMAQPLVVSYSEGNGYYTLTGIELPEEDIEFV